MFNLDNSILPEKLLEMLYKEGYIDLLAKVQLAAKLGSLPLSYARLWERISDQAVCKIDYTYFIDICKICDIIEKEGALFTCHYSVIRNISHTRIRGMLGKWYSPTQSQPTVNEVVEDIYCKIAENVQGSFSYRTGKGKFEYKLIIEDHICLFISRGEKTSYRIIR